MKTHSLITTAVLAISLAACAGNTETQSIWQTEAVQRGDLTTYVIANGTVRPIRSADLNWEMTGTTNTIKVEIGDLVAKDTVLGGLEPDSLAQTYYNNRIELLNAQKALDDLLDGSNSQIAAAFRTLLDAQDEYDDAKNARDRMGLRRGNDEQVAAAHANYVLAQDKVDDMQNNYDQTRDRSEDDVIRALALANLENAKKERDKALINLNWYKGQATDQEIADSDADVAVAETALEQAKKDYNRLKDGVPADDLEIAQARVAAAQAALDQMEITAPFDGTVTDVRAESGEPVATGTLAFRMEDRSRFLLDVNVAEMDINRIRVDMPVIITFDSIYDKQYSGKVTAVSLTGERSSGVTNYPVTVELEDPDEQVRSGMSAVVKISVDTVQDALLVPNSAVRMQDNQRVIYVVREGEIMPVRVTIELGLSSETVSQVMESAADPVDLQEGDQVVTNPDSLIRGDL